MEKSLISKATLGRIPGYLSMLRELPPEQHPYISATAIAKALSLGEVQVRKDLASVSGAGKPKLGYVTGELIEKLESCLGYNHLTSAVLVGAGKLGRALLQYDEFQKYGVKITAAFDWKTRGKSLLHISAKSDKIETVIFTRKQKGYYICWNEFLSCPKTRRRPKPRSWQVSPPS